MCLCLSGLEMGRADSTAFFLSIPLNDSYSDLGFQNVGVDSCQGFLAKEEKNPMLENKIKKEYSDRYSSHAVDDRRRCHFSL